MNKEKILCTICARGGSKGVLNKNIRMIAGKPLIAHTIEQAKKSNCFDLIVVNSDSGEILETSKKWGADLLVKRTAEMATDTAAKLPVIQFTNQEASKQSGMTFSIHVDLDATSPLRNIGDIQECIAMMKTGKYSNIITGTPSRRSPYFNMVELNADGFVRLSKPLDSNIVRRQDVPKTYDMNASIYVWNAETIFSLKNILSPKTGIYIMPEERSLDIDSEFDFELVEFILQKRLPTQKGQL